MKPIYLKVKGSRKKKVGEFYNGFFLSSIDSSRSIYKKIDGWGVDEEVFLKIKDKLEGVIMYDSSKKFTFVCTIGNFIKYSISIEQEGLRNHLVLARKYWSGKNREGEVIKLPCKEISQQRLWVKNY